jgi:hypothetical protein
VHLPKTRRAGVFASRVQAVKVRQELS